MKNSLHYHLTARAVAALVLLLASPAFAQDDRWWRVELLIFSHEPVQTTEQWEPTPELDYPSAARFLVEPKLIEANIKQYRAQSMVDVYGRQILTIQPTPGANTPTDAIAGPIAGQTVLPTPFVALPGAQLEFRGKAAYMQRSGKYRTLFHQTWVQPVADQASALSIVLDRSGDTGEWPRLQGSIKIYLSRYLHLETNLWLNTAGDYLPGTWRMPPAPLGPPSLIIEEQPSSLPVGVEGLPPTEEEQGPVYPYRHAVLLQQERRMRSSEVHYIDHPMLGVVAKLTPLTADELAAMARAEAGSGRAQSQ